MIRAQFRLIGKSVRFFSSESLGPNLDKSMPEYSAISPIGQKDQINETLNDLKFPFKLEGFSPIPDKKFALAYQQILAYSQISEQWLMKHFEKMFHGMIYSMAASDSEFIDEYLESNFAKNVKESNEGMKKKGLKEK
jgi:hypothetical protein